MDRIWLQFCKHTDSQKIKEIMEWASHELKSTKVMEQKRQESLALASMARDDPPASSTAAMRGKVGSEFET